MRTEQHEAIDLVIRLLKHTTSCLKRFRRFTSLVNHLDIERFLVLKHKHFAHIVICALCHRHKLRHRMAPTHLSSTLLCNKTKAESYACDDYYIIFIHYFSNI